MEKKEPKIKIFVSHHKPGYIYEDDVFVPIQVGKKNAKVDLGILGDDTGDNISDKNSNYAELTAQYWVWKNYDLSDVDYVGFCHYRRYMTYSNRANLINVLLKGKGSLFERLMLLKEHNYIDNYNTKILNNTSKGIKKFIKNNDFDIYLSTPDINIQHTNRDFYSLNDIEQRALVISKMIEIMPDIVPYLNKYQRSRKINRRNIFIMNKKTFLIYQEWLFNTFFGIENLKYNDGKLIWNGNRLLGIFAENLINIFALWYKEKHRGKIQYDANLLFFN